MGKWLRRFCSSGFFIPFILLLPYVCTIALSGADKALLLYSPGEEEMLPLVLVVQMKGDYEDETMMAQAVIARSEVYRRLEEGENKREILKEVNKKLTGKKYLTRYRVAWKLLCMENRLQQSGRAVEATTGQVLTYNGKLKPVPYHEISSGKTRDGVEVFHSEEYAYLKSVDSSQDKESPDYVNSTYVPMDQLPTNLVIKKRDSAGYVTALTADGSWLEGEDFRQGMGLASADFSVQKLGKMARFLCKGKGHGLGFSQYGGNEMAKNGSSWEEILATYFPEMKIEERKAYKY